MAMQLQTDATGACLLALVTGDFEVGHAIAIQQRLFEAARRAGLSSLLIDVRGLRGTPLVMHRYKLSLSVAEESRKLALALGAGARVAFLGYEPQIAQDHFGEDVAVNRGANMRVFTDEGEARAWLQSP